MSLRDSEMNTLSNISQIIIDALEKAPEAFVIYDKEGYLLTCNESFRALYGYSKEQTKPGTNLRDLVLIDIENGNIPLSYKSGDLDVYLQCRSQYYEPQGDTLEVPFKDGRWISFREQSIPDGGIISVQRNVTKRKTLEQKFRKTSALFRAVFNANESACSVTVMETGEFLDVNDIWCKLVGYSREEALSKTAVELSIWGDPGSRDAFVQELKKNPAIRGFETSIRTKTGEMRDVVLSSEIVELNGHNYLFLSTNDVTDKIRSEKAHKASEHRFKLIFDDAPIGMAVFDNDSHKMLIGNRKYLEIIGLSAVEAEGIDWRTITHPDDIKEDLHNLARLNAGEIDGYLMEKKYVRANGKIRWTDLSVTNISFSGEEPNKQHLAMLTDITEKKDAELALEVSRDRFADFTTASTDWYWETDPSDRFTYISSVVAKSLGYAENEYIGKTFYELSDQDSMGQSAVDILKLKLKNREAFHDSVMYRFHKETGKKVWLRMTGQPFYDSKGEFLGFRGSTANISEQVELEEKFQQSQKMEAVGQLTGGIAHDFNNLLAVIQGNTELVSEALEDGRQVSASQLSPILHAAHRGAELTQSMLAFSRKQNLHPSRFRLDQQVKSMVGMLQRTLGETITIETDFSKDLWYCQADSGKVENAMLNLCINARDAMPDGGVLTIKTYNAFLDKNFAETQADTNAGKYTVLVVSDTGCGISQEQLNHVFEPFYTTKEVGKGTGLGLSMVYGFAFQSQGHVSIKSELDVGTTVNLYLPSSP